MYIIRNHEQNVVLFMVPKVMAGVVGLYDLHKFLQFFVQEEMIWLLQYLDFLSQDGWVA